MEAGRTRVVLINPPSLCVEDDRLEPPLGLLYLAGTALQAGYERIQIADMSGCRTSAETRERIAAVPEAHCYGLTSLCTNYKYARRLVGRIRQVNPDAYVILGGPNPSALPDFTIADSGADAVVLGEGEDAFLRCLESLRVGDRLRGVVRGCARPDVDSYAFPARGLVAGQTYSRRLLGEPVVSVLASRGCPHHCAHCNSVIMGGGSRTARFRSPANLAAEVGDLRSTYRCFRFNDDNFCANPKLASVLSRLKELDIVFRVFAQVEDLTRETCLALREAGCVHVSIGLESLNPDNLRTLGKGWQVGHEHNVQVARDAGLATRCYFMVGLPHDTPEGIERDFQEASHLGVDEFVVYPLIPYPGTRIWREPERYGYTLVDDDFGAYIQIGREGRTTYALRHVNFGPEDVQRWKARAEEVLRASGAVEARRSPIAV